VKAAPNGIDDGTISALILCSDEGETLLASIDGLRQALHKRRQVQPGFRLRIAAESRLRYSLIMEVLDACLEAGFANVGFVPPPDLAR
jgi:biopolymer transport protein ExbD